MAAHRMAAALAPVVLLSLVVLSTGALAAPVPGLRLPLSGLTVLDAGWSSGLVAAGAAGDKGFLLANGSLHVVSLPGGLLAYAVLIQGLPGGPAAALPWSSGVLLVYPNGSTVALDAGEPLVPVYAWCGGGACAVSAAARHGGAVLYTMDNGWHLLSLGDAVPVAAAVHGSSLLVAAALPSGGGVVFAYGPGGVLWAVKLPGVPEVGYWAGNTFCVAVAVPRMGELLCFNETGSLAWTAALPPMAPPVHVSLGVNGTVYIVSATSITLVRDKAVEAYMLRPMGLLAAGVAEARHGPLLVVYTRDGLVSAAPLMEALKTACLRLGDAQLGFTPWRASMPPQPRLGSAEVSAVKRALKLAPGPAAEKLTAEPGPAAAPSQCRTVLSETIGGSKLPKTSPSAGAVRHPTSTARTVVVTTTVTRMLTVCPGGASAGTAVATTTVTKTVTVARTITAVTPKLYTVTEQIVEQTMPGWLVGVVAILIVAVAAAAYLLGERRGLELAAGV